MSVAGCGSFVPDDPFDSGSGFGFGSEGTYQITIGLDAFDKDFYSFELDAGDILEANVDFSASHLTLRSASNQELIGSNQDISFIYPGASPLPGGGNASLSWVIDTPGTYTIAVDGGVRPYVLNLRVFRPKLELQPRRNHQILFLDFDGAVFDTASFGLPGERTLSPLSDFLDGWGLTPADEDAVIDSTIASVEENFADIGLLGNNGDFESDGTDGHYDIEILNSRD